MVYKTLKAMVAVLLFGISLFGQQTTVVKKMTTVQMNETRHREIVLPVLLEKKLSKLLLTNPTVKTLKGQNNQADLLPKNSFLLKATQFFRTDAVTNKDGTVSVQTVSHPIFYPAVLYQEKVYVFSQSNVEIDTKVFNLLLSEINLKIQNKKEAEELASLFFSVTRGYFENNGKLILSDIEDVPLYYRKDKEAEAKKLQEVVTSPKTKVISGSYEVELFTWEMTLGEVKKWNFKIQSNAEIEVQTEIVGKL